MITDHNKIPDDRIADRGPIADDIVDPVPIWDNEPIIAPEPTAEPQPIVDPEPVFEDAVIVEPEPDFGNDPHILQSYVSQEAQNMPKMGLDIEIDADIDDFIDFPDDNVYTDDAFTDPGSMDLGSPDVIF